MSCSNYKSTINITSNKVDSQKCSADCAYTYSHNKNSSCRVINRGNYLEIKTDGSDNVKFNNETKTINQIRLYQPSLHLFNGSQVDAELIISYYGSGNNLLVCVPVEKQNANGSSNTFFSKFMPYVSKEKNINQAIQTSSWSLNNVLNYNTPYYYYLGSTPYSPCNGKQSIIVFDKKNSAKINSADLNSLKSYISRTPKAKIGGGGYLMYNLTGAIDPNNPNGGDGGSYDLVSCVEVNGLGNDASDSKPPMQESIFSKMGEGGEASYGAIFGYILGGLILIILLIVYVPPMISKIFHGSKNILNDPPAVSKGKSSGTKSDML